jgi:hypothetical protein
LDRPALPGGHDAKDLLRATGKDLGGSHALTICHPAAHRTHGRIGVRDQEQRRLPNGWKGSRQEREPGARERRIGSGLPDFTPGRNLAGSCCGGVRFGIYGFLARSLSLLDGAHALRPLLQLRLRELRNVMD